MRIAALAHGLNHARLSYGNRESEITDITNDSRRVSSGALYAALPGAHVDGNAFVPDAIACGARAILTTEVPPKADPRLGWLTAREPRLALSEISDRFYGSPSRELETIGVTGTDGKTSTVYFVHQLLAALTGRSAFLSTAALQVGPREEPNMLHQSTPEAPEVHRTLHAMLENGARYAVVESTSHGLSMKTARLAHVRYRAAVYTNLSHEHLEFHGTFARYRSDKANLFRALDAGCFAEAPGNVSTEAAGNPPQQPLPARTARRLALPIAEPFGVVNADDAHAGYFANATDREVVTYALGTGADYTADRLETGTTGSTFVLVTPSGSSHCTLPVPGRFNVANALAAVAVVQGLLGAAAPEIAAALGRLRSVRGRMNVVVSEPFSVVVDYAHTPGSFEHILPFFRSQCSGRLIVVFGSAGERDVAKRPIQGRLADRYADLIILTDEDPRGEDRMEILRQIAAGCRHRSEPGEIALVPDRRAAIARAFGAARPGDTVLLLGKGHETSIIGAKETVVWDEIAVAREELERIGITAAER